MRTDAMLRKYAHTNAPAPEDGWKRLVWMAAELVKRSQMERRTWRELREAKPEPVYTFRLEITGTKEALRRMKEFGLGMGIAFKNIDKEAK